MITSSMIGIIALAQRYEKSKEGVKEISGQPAGDDSGCPEELCRN
jgi:hypothetical protein